MTKHRRLVVGNWKMNGYMTSGVSLARGIAAKAVARRPLSFDVVICPPATLIWPVAEAVIGSPVMLGGQDCHHENQGAFTGNISAGMLADLGCRYVILGHSERRAHQKETNENIAAKVAAAQLAGLVAIVCVGESREQKEKGKTKEVIVNQIKLSVPKTINPALLVIAYEPVWAIGTGEVPQPAEISAVHRIIRKQLGQSGATVPIIYGGSVTAKNAGSILQEQDIDGCLVGSASLDAEGFWEIAEQCKVVV